MHKIPIFLQEMVRREPPIPNLIVPGSTPVVSFGDFRSASIATLGINPSNREFELNGALLTGKRRRLSTLESLGASSLRSLTDDQVTSVLESCYTYFSGPYYGWFDTLNKVLIAGLGVSYLDRTACHLDLVQWATANKWNDLTKSTRQLLLSDGEVHLLNLLEQSNISTVVVNGKSVWESIELAGLGTPVEIDRIYFGKTRTTCKVFRLDSTHCVFIGWSSNLQSQHGANSPELLNQLTKLLKSGWLQR